MNTGRRAARALAALVLLLGAARLASAAAHVSLDIQLEPQLQRLDALAELVSDGDVVFALHRSLAVRRATADGRPTSALASGEGEFRQWRIAAPRGAKVNVAYGGTLPSLDGALDHRRVLHGIGPMTSTAGTFLPAGSGWYPHPRGLFSYSVRLSLPRDQRGLVPGRLVTETLPGVTGERYLARFDFDIPSEGIDLFAGPYVVKEKWLDREGSKPVRLRTYFFADVDPLADGYLDDAARYIGLYSRQIGAYPFDAFSIVASPLPTGFAMPTLTYIGAQVLKLPFIRATSLGHEVLHSWWGHGVQADYARGNWSEGLTTFMADYAYKEQESAAAAYEMRQSWLRDFAAVPEGAHRPLTAFRSRTHGAEAAVGYGKAAMVFFMLRDAIGSASFDRGIRLFWQKHRFRTASWNDLRAAFEQASGHALGMFFEQWVQRIGGPTVRVVDARARRAESATVLEISVTQAAPAYALRVPFEILYGDKTETRNVDIERERETVSLAVDAMPEGVRLDPQLRLWRVLDPRELAPVLRQWIIAPKPKLVLASADRDVRLAAEALARSFFESRPQEASLAALTDSREPVLIVGLHGDIETMLAAHAIASRPPRAGGRGSVEVWTVKHPRSGTPVAIVSARDADALKASARALPHYGAQSYLVFEGAKVVARGVWPAETPVVPVRREDGR